MKSSKRNSTNWLPGWDYMSEIVGRISAKVNPTESIDKVSTAITKIFGDIELTTEDEGEIIYVIGQLEGMTQLSNFRDIISRMRIRDAARSFLNRITQGDILSFGLNKQAAYAGSVSFHQGGESPLGPIQVYLSGDVIKAIEYLCGRVVLDYNS